MNMRKSEIRLWRDNILSMIDNPRSSIAYNSLNYENLIPKKVNASGLKIKIARKLLNPFTLIIRYFLGDYLKKRAIIDAKIENINQEIINLNWGLNTILSDSTYETHKLIEKFKSEILAELAEVQEKELDKIIKSKVINPDKLNKTDKVNLGCGTDIREGYINVDHRPLAGVDVVADINKLPFKKESLTEIYLSHIIEHFTERELDKTLPYLFSLLKKKGKLVIIVPDIEAMALGYGQGDIEWDQLRRVILGGQDYRSDYHYNQFSEDYMRQVLEEKIPQSKIHFAAKGRVNGEALELEVWVVK